MNTKNFFRLSTLAIVFATVLSSCKKDYTAPPESSDPVGVTANISITALKARHNIADGSYTVINDDVTICGIVIANDKSGNLYKDIYIRDISGVGAIDVSLASAGLYANYPVGRKVFIKCKGLCLSDYRSLITLGVKSSSNGIITLEGIPAPLITKYVIAGSLGNNADPKIVTQAQIDTIAGAISPSATKSMLNPLVGELIQLNDYEFQLGDTRRTFGDTSFYHSTPKGFTNIKQCGGSNIIIASSGYCDFANNKPPTGHGNIKAILTVYGTTPQLVLRSPSDIDFNGARCNIYEEDFASYTATTSCWSQPGWQNIKESGNTCYTIGSFGGTFYAKISAFSDTNLPTKNITSWLITPAIVIPSGIIPKIGYTCASRYTTGTMKCLISNDYNGTSQTPGNFAWTELNTVQANSASFTAFLPQGPVDISAFTGKTVYLAFKYEAPAGTSKSAVATYEVSGIKITKN